MRGRTARGDTIQVVTPNESVNIFAAEFTRTLDKRLLGQAERVRVVMVCVGGQEDDLKRSSLFEVR